MLGRFGDAIWEVLTGAYRVAHLHTSLHQMIGAEVCLTCQCFWPSTCTIITSYTSFFSWQHSVIGACGSWWGLSPVVFGGDEYRLMLGSIPTAFLMRESVPNAIHHPTLTSLHPLPQPRRHQPAASCSLPAFATFLCECTGGWRLAPCLQLDGGHSLI